MAFDEKQPTFLIDPVTGGLGYKNSVTNGDMPLYSGKLSDISSTFVAIGTQTDALGIASGVLVDGAGVALSTLRGNIVPRTGLLASLLTLAGGVGEIAVATDVRAIVKYTGVSGAAIAYYASRDGAYYRNAYSFNTIPIGVDTPLTSFSGVGIFDNIVIDAANGYITIPATAVVWSCSVIVPWSDAAEATATLRKIILQYEDPLGTWNNIGVISQNNTPGLPLLQFLPPKNVLVGATAGKRLRVAVNQASSATRNISPSIDFRAQFA